MFHKFNLPPEQVLDVEPTCDTAPLGYHWESTKYAIYDKQIDKWVRIYNLIKDSTEKSNSLFSTKWQNNITADTIKERKKEYKVGYLHIPDNFDSLPTLSIFGKDFIAPETIDLRDYCVKTEDQGSKPWCAAYAACGFASNILWRKNDYPTSFNKEEIYKYAKSIDGSPKTDGTSLDAVLKALLHFNYFDKDICSVKILRTSLQVKYAIHKFGCCLLGMMVTDEWYRCNRSKSTISGTNDNALGGHAVLACGYNRDGIIIQNSWNEGWGSYGFALITWDEFNREFIYGAVLDNCLYNTKMN